MKISNFVIGLIFIAIIITSLGMGVAEFNKQYGTPTDYNSSDTAIFNKTNELTAITNELNQKLNDTSTKTGVVDILGGFVASAVGTLKVAYKSVDVFKEISMESSNRVPIINNGLLVVGLISIVVILLIFAIISVMVKKDA